MIDKIVPRKLDTSMDLKLTAKDSMIDALNVRVTESTSVGDEGTSDVGVLKNVLGNTNVLGFNTFDFLPPDNDYRIVGSVTDIKSKIIYFFVYSNQQSVNSVFAYDPLGKLPKSKTAPQGRPNSVRLIMSSTRFMFPQDGFVKADVVHIKRSEFSKYPAIRSRMESEGCWEDMNADALLYFTDNKNEPRKINVYRALLNNSEQEGYFNQGQPVYYGYSNYTLPEVDDFISACPRTPLIKAKFEFGYDPSFSGSNFKAGSCFTFAYQYVYKDGVESPISSYSDLAVPKSTLTQGASSYVDANALNVCNLEIPYPNREVEKIKILARQYDTSSFLLIDEVARENFNGNYLFYNNKILTAVSEETVAKQFEAVPKKAYTQTLSNNRLFYGNYVEGFDNVSVEATITPAYENEPKETDLRIYIKPSIRSSAIHTATETDEQKKLKNRFFDGGASFILDVDASDTALISDSIVRFSLKIAPDKNFHLYKKNGWSMPSADSNSARRYVDEGSLSQEYPTSFDDVDSYSTPLLETQQGGIINTRWYYYDTNANQEQIGVKIGSAVDRPLIIPGGQLSYNIEFRYIGDSLFGQEAAGKISDTITRILCNIDTTNDIEVITAQNIYVHDYKLNLVNFQKIASFGPKKTSIDNVESSDSKAYLVSPLFKADGTGAPVGYAIAESAKVTFGFQKVSSELEFNSVNEILLSVNKIADLELSSCIRRPNHDADWIVLKKDFMDVNQSSAYSILQQFLTEVEQESLDLFYQINTGSEAAFGIELDINNLPSEVQLFINNYTKQFGYVDLNPNPINITRNFFTSTSAPNTTLIGTCVIDGEAGVGGGPGYGTYSNLRYDNPGSIFIQSYRLPLSNDLIIGGYFFLGAFGGYFSSDIRAKRIVVNSTPGGQTTYTISDILPSEVGDGSASMPLRKAIESQVDNPTPYKLIPSNIQQETHAHIEVTDKFIDAFVVGDIYDYRSFKTNSFHEFGVVYYDKRGRHGFVNTLKPVYIPGYSDADRGGAGKGKVNVRLQVTSPHPSWADTFKIVHSRSTSTERFIQYTAGGAFVRHSPQSEDEENVYVSLNYLQSSVVSYSSSFGARSPEGGLDLYKFAPGDRVRIISFQPTTEAKVYPQNFDFEVVDLVNLGEDNNPLFEGTSNIPYNKQGYFLVLRDNPAINDFNYNSVKNSLDKWGNNCLIEVYTPSRAKDQSSKIFYELTNPVPTNAAVGLAPITLKNGDVWWRPIALNIRNFNEDSGSFDDLLIESEDISESNPSRPNFRSRYVESMTFTDLYKGDSHGLGRPNVYLPDAQEVRNESGIVYSQPTAQSASRIKYSDFNSSLLNFKDVPEAYGPVVYLVDRGDSLLCIQDSKCSLMPIGRSIISDTAGNELISSSTNVLGTERYMAGQVGCDNTPESVVDVDGTVYFVNKSLGKVFAVGDSSYEEISSIGMKSHLRDEFKRSMEQAAANSKIIKVPAGFDPINDEYIFTIRLFDKLPESIPFEPAYVYGCVDNTSCNYNPDANIDDGTCRYAEPFRNCAGGCINDTDGDGICNELEIGGCQDPNADNYDPLATDAGTCIYYGCTNQSACNYDSSATHDNGTCIFPTPYRDCNGNCTETARIIINGEEVDTGICLDIATPDTIVVACDDPESCGYQDPTPNVFYHPSACTYPDLGFNCAGEPVGEAVDDFIAHVNAFGLTYRGLSFLNNYAGTPSYISTGFDFDQDGFVTIADFQTLNTAYGVFIDPEAYVIQPSVQPEVVALRGGQLVGDFPPGATGINNIDDLLGYLANYTPPSGEPDVNDLLEQLVVSAGDPSGDAPIPSSRLQPTETSVGYVDKFNKPLPDVPTTGSEKLKGSYRLLHALAVGELSKAQLQYILVNLLNYTGKPDWHEDTNALTKWFEKGRINTDSIPSLDTLDEDRVNITKKAFTGMFIGNTSKNPINDPQFYTIDSTNVLDLFQVWNQPVLPNPTLSFEDKVFSYNLPAYNLSKNQSLGTTGATGPSNVNDLLEYLASQSGTTGATGPDNVTDLLGFLSNQ